MISSLHTERFLLRPIEFSDAEAMFTMDSDPKVHLYLGNSPVQTLEEINDIIGYIQKQYTEFGIGRFAVIDKKSDSFIGWCGLKFVDVEICGRKDYYDIGYRFLPEYWGQGIATETASSWLKYAFEEMKLAEVLAGADVENGASNRVLQKIGLTYFDRGVYDEVDHNWYRISRQEYEKRTDHQGE